MSIDVRGYQGWEKVVAPNGQIGYKVPNSGYIYDPFLSQAKGRSVFFQDTRSQEEAKAKAASDAAAANSPGRQAMNLGLLAATPIAVQQGFQHFAPATLSQVKDGVQYFSDGSQVLANGTKIPASIASPTITSPVTQAVTATAPSSTADAAAGGFVGPQLPVAGDASFIGPVAPTAASDVAAGSTAEAASGGMFGTGLGAAPLAAVAAGTILGGRSALQMINGELKPWGDESLADKAGRVTLGIATGGLSELGNAFFNHESTRDFAQKNTDNLMGQGKDDPTWQNYVQGMRTQYNAAPSDPTRPYAGKFATWQDYKANGLQANDLAGVYGNLNTYGPDWAHYTPDQQLKITQANIDSGLYDSHKGEVVITDADKAKQNRDTVLGINQPTKEKEMGVKLANRINARK